MGCFSLEEAFALLHPLLLLSLGSAAVVRTGRRAGQLAGRCTGRRVIRYTDERTLARQA